MPLPEIFIFGASDHARVVIDIVELEGRYRIVGLFDSFKPKGYRVGRYEVLGREEDLMEYSRKYGLCTGIIGIGDNWTRRQIAESLLADNPRLQFVTAVHPSSTLSREVVMEPGSIVMARCYVGLNTHIGEGAVVATNSIFEHDSVMGAYSTLGAGSTTGGHVSLGICTAVCLGVTLIHGIGVGDHTVIGAGSIVIDDIPDSVVAYGNPARVVRRRDAPDTYLHMRSRRAICA